MRVVQGQRIANCLADAAGTQHFAGRLGGSRGDVCKGTRRPYSQSNTGKKLRRQ